MASSTSFARSFCSSCTPSTSRAVLPRSSASAARRWQTTSTSSTSSIEISTPALARSASTVALPEGAEPSASSSSIRLVASVLLSRPPLQSSPLSSFEREYYRYARKVTRALSAEFQPDWYFRKGSQAEAGWKELVKDAEEGKEVVGKNEAAEAQAKGSQDLKDSTRRKDRTLYFLAKKDRKEHVWQFPQGGVEGDESLSSAAIRELLEEFGPSMDVWQTGKVPAASYGYELPPAFQQQSGGKKESRTFFMPARYLRGEPVPNKQEGLVDYAWCTKEEVKERVSEGYYKAIERALAH